MLVGVLALYVRGVRLATPGRELHGELVIERTNLDKTTVAKLFHSDGGSVLVKDGAQSMVLYEPLIKQLARGHLDLRGMERVDKAWHLQLWSCRPITSMEEQVMHRTRSVAPTGMQALYLRWWALVWETAARHGDTRGCAIADLPALVEAPLEEVWPFVEWASNTSRCVISMGGKDDLGHLSVRFLEPLVTQGPPKILVEGHTGALGADVAHSQAPVLPDVAVKV